MVMRSYLSILLTSKLLAISLLAGCAAKPGVTPSADSEFVPRVLGMPVPIVRGGQLDQYVGRLVAVRGVPGQSKVVRLSGVEVRCPDELRGREAYAVGILSKWVVTEADVEQMNAQGLPHDGPGSKYVLYSDLSGKLAEARPIER